MQPIARGSRSDLASTLEEVKTILSVVQQAQEKQGAELVRIAEEIVVLKDDVDRCRRHGCPHRKMSPRTFMPRHRCPPDTRA